MQTLDMLLREIPAFACLDDEQLALVAGCASNVHFAKDDVMFRAGDPAETFYVVRRGAVAVETHTPGQGELLIDAVETGEVVGWSWLFAPYRWHFDGRALTEVRATAFDGACLRGKCERNHDLGYALMSCFARVMIERLRLTQLRLLDVYGDVVAR